MPAVNGIGGTNASQSNNYSTADRAQGTDKTNNWNMVVSNKKDNSDMDPNDFLNLMVAQLKNQDFMNPMDDTQYVTQMAQYSNMQSMQQMASFSQTSYAMSMVGKNVTASRFTVSGDLDTTSGVVQKVSFVDNDYVLYVGSNGKKYKLNEVMEVSEPREEGHCAADPSGLRPEISDVAKDSAKVAWSVPTEDEAITKGLTYQLYYSKEGPFTTLEDVEKGKSATAAFIKDTEFSLTGLDPDTTYYVNVVVKDADGNKAVYKPATVTTFRG